MELAGAIELKDHSHLFLSINFCSLNWIISFVKDCHKDLQDPATLYKEIIEIFHLINKNSKHYTKKSDDDMGLRINYRA